MAKNYDLFLERMKQKYNVPQTTYKPQTALQKQNTLSKTKDTFYNPSKAEEPQKQTGFDDLNWWNKFGAMYHQARTSFETSFLDLGEGVIDAILTGVGSFADWIGADGLSKTMTDWTKAEWLSALPEQDWFNDYFGLDFLFSEEAQEVGRRDEALPEIVDNVASGIGSAVGYGLLNMVPVVGPALAWMGGGGAAAEQALNEGASNTEAMLYGGAVGGVEFATEKFLGKGLEKAGLGLGKFAGWGKGTSTTAKQVGKSALSKIASNFGKNFFEEGMEEVVSELADPLLKKGTYKRDESLKELWGEQVTAENLIQTFLIGGLTGGVMEGANIAGGIVSSGGIKNWDIRQEAQQLQIINSQMEQAILEGDEQKLKELQAQKEQAIKSVEEKFNTFVEATKENPNFKKALAKATYEVQRDMSQEDLTLNVAKTFNESKNKVKDTNGKNVKLPNINVEYSKTDKNGKMMDSHYDPNTNTIYLNKENLSDLKTALETITHEVSHAIHTSGLNTNFVNEMINNLDDVGTLVENEADKGKINSVEDLITYYEVDKNYKQKLLESDQLKDYMSENKVSKEQAYKDLRNNYMLEEIANDIFSKKYFNNLLELKAYISGAKPRQIEKIKKAYRKLYTNTPNKPNNYKEVMKIFTDGINQNFDSFYETEILGKQTNRRKDIRYELSETKQETKETYKVKDDKAIDDYINEKEVKQLRTKVNSSISSYENKEKPAEMSKAALIVCQRNKELAEYFYNALEELSKDLDEAVDNNDADFFNANIEDYKYLCSQLSDIADEVSEYSEYVDVESEWENPRQEWLDANEERVSEANDISDEITNWSDEFDIDNYEDVEFEEDKETKEKDYYDFERLQRESQEMPEGEAKLFSNGDKIIDEKFRQRLATIFRKEIDTRGNSSRYDDRVVVKNEKFVVKQIDPTLFRDIFEITKVYLKNNELVDLHDVKTTEDSIGYEDCDCFLNEDGLSGFAITKYGDLISVFNCDITKRGWLYAIEPYVKENAKTLDCFQSAVQPLKDMYEKILGFKSASVMDFNIEYRNQEFADKYNSPSVIFMVNTNKNVETKEFDKDSYDKALEYRNSFLNEEKETKPKEITPLPENLKKPEEIKNYIVRYKGISNETMQNKYKKSIEVEYKNAYDFFKSLNGEELQNHLDLIKEYNALRYEFSFPSEYDFNELINSAQNANKSTKFNIENNTEQKEISELGKRNYMAEDFTKTLTTKDAVIKTALEILRDINIIFNGSIDKKQNITYSLDALIKAINSKLSTLKEKEDAFELYKVRYEALKNLSNQYKNVIKHSKNKDFFEEKETKKIQNEIKENSISNGYLVKYDIYSFYSKPSTIIIEGALTQKQIENKKEEKVKNLKEEYKNKLDGLVKNYDIINEDQENTKEKILLKINEIDTIHYENQEEKIKVELNKFEEVLRTNYGATTNVRVKKQKLEQEIKNRLHNFPNEVERQEVKDIVDEIKGLISQLTYKNYEDESDNSVSKQINSKLDVLQEELSKFDKEANSFIELEAQEIIDVFDLKEKEILEKFDSTGKDINKYLAKNDFNSAINNSAANSKEIEALITKKDTDIAETGLKDLIENIEKLADNYDENVQYYIDQKLKPYKERLKVVNDKLAKLDNKIEELTKDKTNYEKMEELKVKAQEVQDKYTNKLNETLSLNEGKSSEQTQKLVTKIKNKINSIDYKNFKNNDINNEISDMLFSLTKVVTQDIKTNSEEKEKELLQKTTEVEKIKIIREKIYVYRENAKSIKDKAKLKGMETFTKTDMQGLIEIVKNMILSVGKEKGITTRLEFKGGQRKIRDDLFEAFNTLSDQPTKLINKCTEILMSGLQVKVLDYQVKDGKIVKETQGRQTYKYEEAAKLSREDSSVIFEMARNNINNFVKEVLEEKGKQSSISEEKQIENVLDNAKKRNQMLENKIAELENKIEELTKEVEKETTEIKTEIVKVKDNKELSKLNNKLENSYKKIEKLNSLLEQLGADKQEVIIKLKTKIAELKLSIKQQTAQIRRLNKENAQLKTNLTGTFEFSNGTNYFINRQLKSILGVTSKLETNPELYNKIADRYSNGDVEGVVDGIIEFLKGEDVKKEFEEYNDKTNQIEYKYHKVPFTSEYSESLISQLRAVLENEIADRMSNPNLTRESALPKALKKLSKLKEKIVIEKKTKSKLNNIKNTIKSIKALANNKRTSLLSNKIDKRFQGIAQKLENYSQYSILNGEFREVLLELKDFLLNEKFGVDKETFTELTGIEIPQELFNKIEQLEGVEGQVTLEELEIYEKILSSIKSIVESGTGQRKVPFKKENGESYTVEEFVQEAIKEQEEILQKLGITQRKFRKILQTVDPRVVFKILSGFNENSKLYKMFEMLQKGDTQKMFMEMHLKEKLVNFYKENKGFKKKLKQTMTINGIETTVGQFISIYKLIRRKHSYAHIVKNGIDVDGRIIRFKDANEIALLKKSIADTLELKKEGSLMKEYFDLTVKFFKDAGNVKKEIDEKLYGYSDIEEGEYFPIQISAIEFTKTLGETKYVSRMAASFNYSWQHTIVGTKGAVKIGNVQDIIELHSRQVSDYSGYGVPLDLFNQLYSYKILDKDNNRVVNLRQVLNESFGVNKKTGKYQVEDYIKILFDDIRGVNTYIGEVDGFFKGLFGRLRKKYSTYVLGANLKTAVVQLGAIPGAYKYISLKNMLKAAKPFSKEMKEKYPLPTLGKYRTYDKTILQSQTLNDEIGDLAEKFGIVMTKADQATIKFAWKAALYETVNADGTFNEDKAKKLFEKIVRETQPQYSAIERSALMRSKNDLVKLFTQFQSQSNKNFSTMVEVVYKAIYYKKMGIELSKQDKLMFYKATVSVATQGVFAVAITYLFKFFLHDLDEEDKEPLAIISNFINEAILGIVPLMNNIRLDLTGNGKFFGIIDFYEPSLGMIDKLSDALTDIGQLANPDKTTPSKIYDAVNALGMILGIPTENIYKYSMGVLKWILPNKAFSWDANIKGISMTNKSEINEALKNGKIDVAKQYYQTYTSNILELDDYTTNVLFNLYKKGFTNAYIKQVPKTLVIDNEQVKVDRDKFIKTYSKLTPQLNKLVKSSAFNGLTDDEKEKTLSKLINVYYSLAKKEQIENAEYSDLELIFKYCNNFKSTNLSYLVHISNIEETKTKTRKEMVQRYIQTLPLYAGEKYLLYVLSGYSISDKNRNILRSFLSASGMPTKQINILLG